ncbi:MAG TPA: alpha/beta hydrolase [Mycobacteriales bacterium]|nr:alpha/beta hydrolase [Mycobacteriales bacterium]
MPIDPGILALAPMMEQFAPTLDGSVPLAEVRRMTNLAQDTSSMLPADLVVHVGSVEDRTLDGPAGPLPVRIYRPDVTGPVPTVVFFHGGGFVFCNLNTHDSQARLICRDSEAVVVSVDYRLAPENPFPSAVDDCLWATRWAAEHIDELGGDASVLAVAGDSAGGNLAAVVAQQCRDAGPALAAQLLIYPVVDLREESVDLYPSIREHATDGILLTEASMTWFHANYAPDREVQLDVRCSPVLAEDLSGLPAAIIATAEYDPLRDEGEVYADHLRAAGVPVELRRYDGLTHGFFGMGLISPASAAAAAELGALFRDALRKDSVTA